ncbi:Polyketide synthase PksL [Anatilimnocola aggregata]|uniref:Polyketide synthase PksL n=1 Tax=Anatilimnocola aggregata TaxID=2528021 RepID=A0A517YCS8_9BACT|nr:type I polyketide synthase [Anatilimnocola aggregata]QDU28028.1 Polyketide synthase PksL [Anatilimnocola aggregata]
MTSAKLPQTPIAIVGMAARLPGAANLDEYWNLIRTKSVGYGQVPESFLERELYFHPDKGVRGKAYTTLAGIVPVVDPDPRTCRISDSLRARSEPAHLTYADTVASAFRHAGYDPFHLPTKNVGVYVGHAKATVIATDLTFSTKIEQAAHVVRNTPGFEQLSPAAQQRVFADLIANTRASRRARTVGPQPFVGSGHLPATIAEIFGLEGPQLAIDAACASSLFSLALGALALDRGEVDMAIVGGASQIRSDVLVLFCQAQTCSAYGSYPFDARADGMVPSDGYTVALLKTLPRAQADGDKILGVISGIGISSDGKGKSLWAPRKEGQVLAMQRAYGTWHDPALTQYVECHATATQVGDATELEALREFFQPHVPAGRKIPIGGVKANIGHTLESAGMAGLIKLLLAMQHEVFPVTPTNKLSESIPWDQLPVRVSSEEQPWPRPAGGLRRAGVNAFGIGGLNVHVIVDEAPPRAAQPKQISQPTLLSATNGKDCQCAANGQRSPDAGLAIIGRGVVLPGAFSLESLRQLVRSAQDPKSAPPAERWIAEHFVDPHERRPHRVVSARGGFIRDWNYDWRKHKIPPKQLATSSPLQFMLLDCVEQALGEAKLDPAKLRSARTAVVVGGGFGGEFAAALTASVRIPEMERTVKRLFAEQNVPAHLQAQLLPLIGKRLLDAFPNILDETGSFTSSTLASRISKHFDLNGGAVAIDAGDASALAALAIARNLLESGVNDYVICAVGYRGLDLVDFEATSLSGYLSKSDPKSPFSKSTDGCALGEGAGVWLLQRSSAALRDGNQAFGIVRGIGHAASTQALSDAVAKAAQQACNQAKVLPAEIATVEVAGSGDAKRVLADLTGLQAAFSHKSRVSPLHLSSGVPQFGSLCSAQGIVALMRASLSIEQGEALPTLGHTDSHPLLTGPHAALSASQKLQSLPSTIQVGSRLAGVATLTDRGFAMHAILEYGTPAPVTRHVDKCDEATPEPRVVTNAPEIPTPSTPMSVPTMIQLATPEVATLPSLLRVGAASPEALLARLKQLSIDLPNAWRPLLNYQFNEGDAARAVFVAANVAELQRKLELAIKHFQQTELALPLMEQGIFIASPGNEQLRTAFVFAGQGSQYTGMLQNLIEHNAVAREAQQEIETSLAKLGCVPFAQLAWQEDAGLGQDVFSTQISILAADTILYRTLTASGIKPDIVCGHSYGEYPALVAAGAMSFEQAVRLTQSRCRAIEASRSGPSGMLSTSAPVAEIERTLREQRLPAYIANYNAPAQTIMGGTLEALEQLEAALVSGGALVKRLNVPRAFHTPLIADAKPAFRSAVRRERLHPARIPLLSSVSNRFEADPEVILDNLVDQLTEPVRYPELIRRLTDDGVTLLIEVGPKQVLTGLHRAILPTLGAMQVRTIATDNPKQPGGESLLRVQALWECLGGKELASVSREVASRTLKQTNVEQGTANAQFPIVHFDATLRRKEKLKQSHSSPSANGDASHSPAAATKSNGHSAAHGQPTAAAPQHAPKATTSVVEPILAPRDLLPDTLPDVLPVAQPQAAPVAVAAAPSTSVADMEQYLVNFVVDQTGYPPEFVELDADLEADLGIDSIKKAQLFGELNDQFQIPASTISTLTLDQFPTLRHIAEFLQRTTQGTSQPVSEPVKAFEPATVQPTTAIVVPIAADSKPTVAEHALPIQSLPAVTALNAPVEQVLTEEPSAVTLANPTENATDLEQFLIQFVVDQTGYPQDFVELDADLEADLGIDSIKKAQLFGELNDHFEVTSVNTNNLTLDQFPTLRHIVEFLRNLPRRGVRSHHSVGSPAATQLEETSDEPPAAAVAVASASPVEVAELEPVAPTASTPAPVAPDVQPWNDPLARENFRSTTREALVYRRAPVFPAVLPQPASGSNRARRLLCLAGTPFEMGLQQANACGDELKELLKSWSAMPSSDQELVSRARRVEQAAKWLGRNGVEELRGLAEGLGVPLQLVIAFNLVNDAFQPTTMVGAKIEPGAGVRLLLAENAHSFDSPETSEFQAVQRTCAGRTVTLFGLPGQLGARAGVSSHGLAMVCLASSTSDATSPEFETDNYVSGAVLLRKVLTEADSFAQAQSLLQSQQLPSGWSFLVADLVGEQIGVLTQQAGSWTKSVIEDSIVLGGSDESASLRNFWKGGGVSDQLLAELPAGRLLLLNARRVESRTISKSKLPAECHRQSAWSAADLALPETKIASSSQHLSQLPAESARVGHRYVLKLVPAPLEPGPRAQWHGSALILGDNLASRALARQLRQEKVDSVILDASQPLPEIIARVEAECAAQSVPHLFLMQGWDTPARCDLRHAAWQTRKQAGMLAPFAVAQRWHQLTTEQKLLEQCTLAAAVSLGGNCGLTAAPAFEGAATAGMIKSLTSELRYAGINSFRAKIVDSPAHEDPQRIAIQLLRELASGDRSAEVAYRDDERHVLRIVREAASSLATKAPTRGGVWVVTGGARGVTSVTVRELAARYGSRLHLLGSSPQPQVDPAWLELDAAGLNQLKVKILTEARAAGAVPAKAWSKLERGLEIQRNLLAMQAAGVAASYHQCDVADVSQLTATIDKIRHTDGPITGIVHGAGIEAASQFARKKWESIVATLNIKIDGALGLLDATRNDPVEFFLGFGSVSGLVGGPGQADYAMANYLLCNLMERIRHERPGCLALGVHWSAFDGTGMAARPESRLALEKMGAKFMSPEEGAAHLIDEFERGLPSAQIAFCEPNGKVAARLAEQADAEETPPLSVSTSGAPQTEVQPSLPPMLDRIESQVNGASLAARVEFCPARDPFLWHHRLYGKPFLPAVISLETMLQAAELFAGRPATAIRNLALVNGLAVPEDQTREARVTVTKEHDRYSCQLTVDLLDRKGRTLQKDRVIAAAEAEFAESAAPLQAWPDHEPPLGLLPAQYVDFSPIYHGAPFRRLKSYFSQYDGGFGSLQAEDLGALLGARGTRGARTPAAILDACLFACGSFSFWMFEKRIDVPHSIGCLQLGSLPDAGEQLKLRFRYRGSEDGLQRFDFQVIGGDAAVILQVTDYRGISLSQRLK